jgi:hypothetical protein
MLDLNKTTLWLALLFFAQEKLGLNDNDVEII